MSALRDAFHAQATSCGNLGSSFMERLFRTLADIWPDTGPLAARCRQFDGAIGPSGSSLPLRIAGGLHALVLRQVDPDLTDLYPPAQPEEAGFRVGLLAALDRHAVFLTDWIDSPPQTNELRRSAALIAGAHVAARQFDLPIRLSELGASGGLNLIWDRYALCINGTRFGPKDAVVTLSPDWTGPMPPKANPVIAERRGVDLMPLDPRDPDDLLRLQAFLWPDQPFRLDMTRAAAQVASGHVDQGDAIDWLETRLNSAPDDHLHLIQNTVAWQYFPADAQSRGAALIQQAGRAATPSRPLGWLQLETDGDENGLGGAAITLRLWPGDLHMVLGRGDFHGRWLRWQGP